jgi:hypothetical protein
VADSLLPAHDAIVLMVNDSEYGGSGGIYAVASMNTWAAEVVTHEFGHSLAGLGDEYEDPYPGFVFADVFPNVSPTADREALKWTEWVDEETPLPTPESAATDPLARAWRERCCFCKACRGLARRFVPAEPTSPTCLPSPPSA